MNSRLLDFLLLIWISTGCQAFNHVLPTRTTRNLTASMKPKKLNVSTALHLGEGSTATITEAVLDLSREGYKLQTMATYSTITALVMNACLRLYTSQSFTKHPETGRASWVQHVFTLTSNMCIISGAFTAVLFNVLGIYSKECLWMQNDVGYAAFQAATAIHRKWGFRTFLSTCLSFVASFLLSVYENAQDGYAQKGLRSRGLWIFALSVLLAGLAVYHVQNVMSLATQFIYTPEFKARHLIA